MVRKFLSQKVIVLDRFLSFVGTMCAVLLVGTFAYLFDILPLDVIFYVCFFVFFINACKNYRTNWHVVGYEINDEYVAFTTSWHGVESVERVALADIKKADFYRIGLMYDLQISLVSGEIRHFYMKKKSSFLRRKIWMFEDLEQLCELLSSSSKNNLSQSL